MYVSSFVLILGHFVVRKGSLPLCYLWILRLDFFKGYAPVSHTILFISLSQTTWTVQAAAGHKSSSVLAGGEWQPVAAQAGAVVLPPSGVQVPLSGFN